MAPPKRHISEFATARINTFTALSLGQRILKDITSATRTAAAKRFTDTERKLAFAAAEIIAANDRAFEAREELEEVETQLESAHTTIASLREQVAALHATVSAQLVEIGSLRSSLTSSASPGDSPVNCCCLACTGDPVDAALAERAAELFVPVPGLPELKAEPEFVFVPGAATV